MDDRHAEYDPAMLLTRAALIYVGAIIVFVCIIIAAQIWKTGEANTESWAALTGLIGWVTGIASVIFNARFGTSKQAETKDAVIAQQSRTAAVIAGATSTSAQTMPVTGGTVTVAVDAAQPETKP